MDEENLNFDVVIAGSGPSGMSAAISSSRNGAKVLLIDRFSFPGGMSTVVPVSMWPIVTAIEIGEMEQSYSGFPQEIVDRLRTLDAIELREIKMDGVDTFVPDPTEDDKVASAKWYIYDPEALKKVFFDLMDETGVEFWNNSLLTGVNMADNLVESIVIETLSGRRKVKGKIFIDATGSADLVFRAGYGADLGHPEKNFIMPSSTTWRIAGVDTDKIDIEKISGIYEKDRSRGIIDIPLQGLCMHVFSRGVVQIFGTRVFNINPLEPESSAEGEKVQRQQIWDIVEYMKKTFPEFRDAKLINTGASLGAIGTRRIHGDYHITQNDILSGKKFDDVIATGTYRVEIWDPESGSNIFKHLINTWYTIPFRCLLPEKIKNVIVPGSSISGQYEAMAAWAIQPVCMLTGQAAGTAAALCSAKDLLVRELDIAELQSNLKNQNVFLGI